MKTIQKTFVIIIFIIALTVLTKVYIIPIFQKKSLSVVILESLIQPITPTLESISPTPTNNEPIKPSQALIPTIKKSPPTAIPTKNIINDSEPWGVAKQIDEHTWTMKISDDPIMATASEILDALNNYRVTHGSQKLTMDPKLTEYAQSRANYFYQEGKLDKHQGFNNYLTNEDGFSKLGFSWMGENASFGYRLNGVHLIEWIYASDEGHNLNQLNNNWNYVGIGVKDTATCLIFGTGKS